MVDRQLVAAKLAELGDRVARVRERCPPSRDALVGDRDALELVSFNLMLAVQSCSDIAGHLIADEGWPPATSLAGAFDRIHERGVISRTTADDLRRAVGLRNVVAHGYSGINPSMVFAAATQGLDSLDRFAREIATWISSSSA